MPSIYLWVCYSRRLECLLYQSYVANTHSSYQIQLEQQLFLYGVVLEC